MKRKRIQRLAGLLCALLLVFCAPVLSAHGAEQDPALRFDLTTEDPTTNLSEGDEVRVNVWLDRQDGAAAAYQLYGVQLDISYDNSLFTAGDLTNAGLKRPDGENWIGGWTCSTTPAGRSGQRIRVMYTNINGVMKNPPLSDEVEGRLLAGSFTLTAKAVSPGAVSGVNFYYATSVGSDLKKGPSSIGQELTLTFAEHKTESGGSTGGAGGSTGSGSAGSGVGSGSAASGQTGGNQSGADQAGESQSGEKGISFSELTDVPENHWAVASIQYLVDRGLMSGNDKRQFQPEKPVTRAEFVQMIVSAFGYQMETAGDRVFEDVRSGDWFYRPVMTLYRAGVVSGTGDGRFEPEATLSRQDMAVILYRSMTDRNITLEAKRGPAAFGDEDKIADYAREALWNLYFSGVISGTGNGRLSPGEESTRAQAATVLTNILKETEERR